MTASNVLPNDLWLQTFGCLSKNDLKAVLLFAKHHLGSRASSLLLTTAYIAAMRGVLDTFKALTTHPVFCKHIKEVIFDSSWINSATVSKHANQEGGSALARFDKEQEEIQVNELQTCLDDAFRCLANVKKVSYADLSRISCPPGDKNDPAWCEDYSEGPLFRRLESDLGPAEIFGLCLLSKLNAGCPFHDDRFVYRRKFGGLIGSRIHIISAAGPW